MVRRRADRCSRRRSSLLRDYRVLERYRYTIAAVGLGAAAAAARARASASRSTAPTSASGSGRSAFQPAEFAQDRDRHLPGQLPARHAPAAGQRRAARSLGITIPPLKHFGPLLVVWGAAMLMLFFIRDLGSSLMFFGGFLALLYVATNRLLVRGRRPGAVRRRRVVPRTTSRPRSTTASTPGCTRSATLYDEPGGSYQIAQSLFAQADGGLFGTGLRRRRCCSAARRRRRSCRPPQTDLIYAVIVNELGLVGAGAAAAASTCWSSSAASRSRCSRATRSPSCSPPG